MTTTVLRAHVRARAQARAPERLVVVDDPDQGPVNVRWVLGRAQPWRCVSCGPMTTADCAHTFAAGLALAEELLGLTRIPELMEGTS